MKACSCVATAVAIVVALFAALAQPTLAQPFAHTTDNGSSIVTPVHGFHCRSVPGWDARVGTYRAHRHEKICRDYQRCVAEHRRCSMALGRSWEGWQLERWGYDNWRYIECMMRHGCY